MHGEDVEKGRSPLSESQVTLMDVARDLSPCGKCLGSRKNNSGTLWESKAGEMKHHQVCPSGVLAVGWVSDLERYPPWRGEDPLLGVGVRRSCLARADRELGPRVVMSESHKLCSEKAPVHATPCTSLAGQGRNGLHSDLNPAVCCWLFL